MHEFINLALIGVTAFVVGYFLGADWRHKLDQRCIQALLCQQRHLHDSITARKLCDMAAESTRCSGRITQRQNRPPLIMEDNTHD